MKIWTWRKLSAKWVPKCLNADPNAKGASRPSNIWNFIGAIQMISFHGWWPWMKPGYITMTRRQSNDQWSGGIAAHPRPKIRIQKSAGKVLTLICWYEDGILPMIIFQWAKLSTRSITHLCWCNWRIFWRKNVAGSSPRWSCFCTTMPRFTGHLQPRRNWPNWTSSVFITHPILRNWPVGIPPVPWTEKKNNWKFAIFLPTRRSLLPRRPGWTDNILIF